MDIEEAHRWYIEKLLGKDFPIGDDDTDLWLQLLDGIQEIRIIFYLLWLQEEDVMIFRVFSDW